MKKKILCHLVMVLLFCGATLQSHALPTWVKFWSKKEEVKTVESSDSTKVTKNSNAKYDKLFKDKSHQKAESDFVTLHWVKNKLYFELPVEMMGRDMLLASTTTKTTDPDITSNGEKGNAPMHIQFSLSDSLVYMHQVMSSIAYDKNDERLSRLAEQNYSNPILEKYKVEAYGQDSLTVVIDVSKLFGTARKELAPIGAVSTPTMTLSATATSDLTKIMGIKAFEDNVSVHSAFSYKVSLKVGARTMFTDNPVDVEATRTLLLLPEEPARERISDSRIGIFLSNRQELSTREDKLTSYSVANRWNVVPKDTVAYMNGELSEPVKPIVFYIDNLFPEEWKPALEEGILRWNKAFEAIGFRDVVQVLPFPSDDPNFDPDNLKYSCVRYVPTSKVNAMGPSWVDPRSGEIINASVYVYNDIAMGVNNWRFVQTAAVDPRVRSKKMSDEIRHESLAYVVSHEVGHCLGLMHNMAASAAVPVDSLRSATYTQKYGTSPSIMDYARFNYVAQPGDEGVCLTPPHLGRYDYYAVEWLYRIFPDIDCAKDEAVELEKFVDAHVGDPVYRYGKQQMASRYDPSAIEEDLGDDPLKAAEYGIANLRYILAHLNEWIDDDADYTHRSALYKEIATQYSRYLSNVLLNVGGIYLSEVKDGTAAKRFESVPSKRQEASLKWVVDQLRTNSWLDDPEIYGRQSLGYGYSSLINYNLSASISKVFSNVALSAYVAGADAYATEEFFADLYDVAWESTIKNRKLTNGEISLQNSLMTMGAFLSNKIGLRKIDSFMDDAAPISYTEAFAPSVSEVVAYGLDPHGLVERYQSAFEELERTQGKAPMYEYLQTQFGYNYAWQPFVKTAAIDESPAYYYDYVLKCKKLLETKAKYGHADDRAHYRKLLFTVNYILSENQM